MKACASVSGGVMFIPDSIEKKLPKITKKIINDNQSKTAEEPHAD